MPKNRSVSITKAENLLAALTKQRDQSRQYAVWAKAQLAEAKTMEPHGFSDERRDWGTIKCHCESVFTKAVRTKIEQEKMVTLYRVLIAGAKAEKATSIVLPLELPPEKENRNVVAERLRVGG